MTPEGIRMWAIERVVGDGAVGDGAAVIHAAERLVQYVLNGASHQANASATNQKRMRLNDAQKAIILREYATVENTQDLMAHVHAAGEPVHYGTVRQFASANKLYRPNPQRLTPIQRANAARASRRLRAA